MLTEQSSVPGAEQAEREAMSLPARNLRSNRGKQTWKSNSNTRENPQDGNTKGKTTKYQWMVISLISTKSLYYKFFFSKNA